MCGFLNLSKKYNLKKDSKTVFAMLKQIFIWWYRQTIGTFIYTLFTGKFIGIDEFGNKYYSNSANKRWVVYKNEIESTKIPPEWHAWIHFIKINKPKESTRSIGVPRAPAKQRTLFSSFWHTYNISFHHFASLI